MPKQAFSRKPEVMSPAGYWPQLRAAVEAGADAVYFGLKQFTARAKVGFSLNELPEVMRTLHGRGVRGYVTFNTLVFERELAEAAETLAAIAAAGADAVIIQDVGVLRLAHQIAPDLELHASTQMSITNVEGVRLAQQMGASRVTLARELSLEEIRKIRSASDCDLEVFVHGALCVAYSGQCFSSEAWGGRSANRGQCAQACRLPYEMIVDGSPTSLGDARYLLSPGDLYDLHQVPELMEIGISTFKIEGRYKDAEYVALTTDAYRRAVDEAWKGSRKAVDAAEDLRLEQVYSRGLGPFFLTGTNHQKVVNGRAPRHRGVEMGRVYSVSPESVVLEPAVAHSISPLKPGDGVVFDAASWRSPEEREEGGRIYETSALKNGKFLLRFGNNAVDFSKIRAGDILWRTHDPETEKAARPFLDPPSPVQKQPVYIRVTAREGQPLLTEWSLINHPDIHVLVSSAHVLEAAQSRALNEETLRDQLGRLGQSPYVLSALDADIEGSPFAPVSLLNQLRRAAIDRLQEAQQRQPRITVEDPLAAVSTARQNAKQTSQLLGDVELHLLVRSPDQLDAAIALRPATITLDYLDLYGLRPSLDLIRIAGLQPRVASPRILKPGEEKIAEFLRRLDCPLLVRSAGLLHALRQQQQPMQMVGDFSLNAANSLTAAAFLELGLLRFTPTYDLNAQQVTELAHLAGAANLEVVAYQHLPVFYTEHCVFCRFLSNGTSYKDCGRPCEKHRVAVRDVSGRAHPVMADVGCRNTVFGAEAQEASSYLEAWLAVGIRHFRLEFVHESPQEVTQISQAFFDAVERRISFSQLAQRWRQIAPLGTTEGSFYVPRDNMTLPVLQ